MSKKELQKDDLEAVLEDGHEVVEHEESEADFLAAFEEEDNGYVEIEDAATPETKDSDQTDGEGDVDKTTPDPEDGEEKEEEGETEASKDDDTTEETPPWLKHIQEMENRIATRMRNVEGHIGGLKSQLMQAKQDAAATGDAAPTNAQIKDATGKKGSTDKLDVLRAEFPEWADALDELETNLTPDASQGNQAPETYSRDEVAYMVNSATERARELARVDAAHPGWDDLRNTPEFANWRDSQPEATQALADSPKAADAIKMFDLYKEATEPQAPANETRGKTNERLKRSVAPRTSGAAPVQHVPTEEEEFLASFNSG